MLAVGVGGHPAAEAGVVEAEFKGIIPRLIILLRKLPLVAETVVAAVFAAAWDNHTKGVVVCVCIRLIGKVVIVAYGGAYVAQVVAYFVEVMGHGALGIGVGHAYA